MKKYIIILAVCLVVVWRCEEFFRREIGGFGGSYPFVETWSFNVPESEVINAIKEIKKNDPTLQPPNQFELTSTRRIDYDWGNEEMIQYTEKHMRDSTVPLPPLSKSNSKEDYWLYVDFYYKNSKQVIETWTRPYDDSSTTFALVAIKYYDRPDEIKLINKDFGYFDNKYQINNFKKNIVDKIQEQLDKNQVQRKN